MRKPNKANGYELRAEYDFAKMTIVPKGRYAPERRAGQNVALLAPDVARAFPTDESVNDALRLVMQMADIPSKRRPARSKVKTSGRVRATV